MNGFTKYKIRPRRRGDARLVVYVAKDYMEAKADFFPPAPGGQPFTKEHLDAALKKLRICFGVEYKAIDDAADDCNSGGSAVLGLTIARALPPVDDSPAYFKIHDGFQSPRLPRQGPDGRVDFRAVSPFALVKAGEEIARLEDAVAGKNGRAIDGRPLPFKRAARREFVEGDGIALENGRMYAKADGLLVIEDHTIRVEQTLRVPGAIGYATGDVIFPGSLVLEGTAADGFKVRAGGNITVRGTFTVSDCLSGGNLVAAGGLIGRARGTVKAGGSVSARFVRNCKLACKENVVVAREIINASIWTLGALDIGRGVLVASEVRATRGMRAGDIGRRSSRPAEIFLGTNWALEGEIQRAQRALAKLKRDIAVLDARFVQKGRTQGALWKSERNRLLMMRSELVAAYKKTTAQMLEAQRKLTRYPSAALYVRGCVAAGTSVSICHVGYVLTRDMRNVCFVLDAQTNTVVPRTGGKTDN
ncbi:MAG: FapA family protein [Spirochaetaceae bacterium]|jgi:uncharacterized protein (DUF342 family)|nr:FapA family protein [Spirochaetaceae bacterium]